MYESYVCVCIIYFKEEMVDLSKNGNSYTLGKDAVSKLVTNCCKTSKLWNFDWSRNFICFALDYLRDSVSRK